MASQEGSQLKTAPKSEGTFAGGGASASSNSVTEEVRKALEAQDARHDKMTAAVARAYEEGLRGMKDANITQKDATIGVAQAGASGKVPSSGHGEMSPEQIKAIAALISAIKGESKP